MKEISHFAFFSTKNKDHGSLKETSPCDISLRCPSERSSSGRCKFTSEKERGKMKETSPCDISFPARQNGVHPGAANSPLKKIAVK
jgi:hypothetical protein